MVVASSALFSSTGVTSGATATGEEPSKGSVYDGDGETTICVDFPGGFFEAFGADVFGFGVAFGAATFELGRTPGVVFVTGVVTFRLGAIFCVTSGAVFAAVVVFALLSRCDRSLLGFGVGLTFVSSAVTLVSERVASDMDDLYELVGERTYRGDRGGDASF